MQQWALFWHISQLSVAPIAVSIVGAVRFGSVLCFSMIGGLAADRYNRRAILFITQSAALMVSLALCLLTRFGVIQLWQIYLLLGDPRGVHGFRSASPTVVGAEPGAARGSAECLLASIHRLQHRGYR